MSRMIIVVLLSGILATLGRGIKIGLKDPIKVSEPKTKISKEYKEELRFNTVENIFEWK